MEVRCSTVDRVVASVSSVFVPPSVEMDGIDRRRRRTVEDARESTAREGSRSMRIEELDDASVGEEAVTTTTEMTETTRPARLAGDAEDDETSRRR